MNAETFRATLDNAEQCLAAHVQFATWAIASAHDGDREQARQYGNSARCYYRAWVAIRWDCFMSRVDEIFSEPGS